MGNIINLYERKTIFITTSRKIQKKLRKRKTGVFKRILIRDLVDLHLVLSNIKQIFSVLKHLNDFEHPTNYLLKKCKMVSVFT